MSILTDVINLNVNVNGNKAQNELNELRKKAANIKFEMKGLKEGTQEYVDKRKELNQVTIAMDALKKEIGLTSLSQKELVRELTRLKSLRDSVTPLSDEYKKFDASIKLVEARLKNVREGVRGFSTFITSAKEAVKSFGIVAAGYLGFQFAVSEIKNVISSLSKLSGQFSDIRKVTGLSEEAVKGLNGELSKIDTRTSTSTLRDMAVAAGKLGKDSAKDILEFVRAADQISVALGDDLSGGTEEIMKNLGKISQVFKVEDMFGTENGLLKIGSAINELSAASNAGADYMVDFTKRMAGVAPLAGINIQQILGLGATLDQFGQTAEVSSTALSKLFIKMASDSAQFAKYARMNVGDFKALMEKDFMSALVRMLEGVRENSNGINQLAASLGELGVDGRRVIGVLGTLANNIPVLRNQIELSNAAFQEGTSITEEFNIQNNDLAATLDKIRKEIDKLRENNFFKDLLTSAANAVLRFVQALKDLPALFERYRFTIIALAVSFTLLTKNILMSAAAWALEKAAMVAEGILAARRMGILLLSAGYNLLTGNINRATAAWTLFNRAINKNVIGLVVTALIGVGFALDKILSKTKELTASQRVDLELAKRVSESTEETKTKIELLTRVANDNNESLDNRKKALSALIAISPEYLSGLTLENLNTQEGTNLLKQYIAQLSARAEAEAKYSLLVEKRKARQQGYSDIRSIDGGARGNFTEEQITTSIDFNRSVGLAPRIFKDMAKLNDEIAALEESIQASLLKDLSSAGSGGNTPGGINSGDSFTSVDKDFNKKNEQLKKEAEKFYKELLQLKIDYQIKGMEPEQREIAAVEAKYEELTKKAKQLYLNALNDKKRYDAAELLIEEAKQRDVNEIFQKYFKERVDKAAETEYEKEMQGYQDYVNQKRILVAQDYADGKISKEEYNREINRIDLEEKQNLVLKAKDYAETVKKAESDLKKFTIDAQKATTEAAIKEMEKRKENAKKEKEEENAREIDRLEHNILMAKPGSNAELEARKTLIEQRFQMETDGMDQLSEMYLRKEEEKNKKIADIEQQYRQQRIEKIMEYVGFFQGALDSVEAILRNNEERLLASEKKSNDSKKASYKKQLDNKLISRAQYDRKIEQADAEMDKKVKDIAREQAKREKALNTFNAIINTAGAIVKALNSPAGYPANIALAAAAGIAGALQIAAIQSAPLPELGTGYWLKSGPKHNETGKGTKVLIERDEAVMSAAAMKDERRYTITGTSAQITSALNSRNGGATWATGARVHIHPDVPRMMASGGFAGQSLRTNASTDNVEALLTQILAEQQRSTGKQQETLDAVSNWKLNSKAWVSIKEYREEEKLYDDAKKASGF